MVEELNQVLEQIKSSIAAYQELGQLLAQNADDVISRGVPPSEELLAAIASARAEFSLIKKRLQDLGLKAEGENLPNSLRSMEQTVEKQLAQEYEAAHQAKRNRLLPLLEKINKVQAATPLYEEPLGHCKSKSLELKQQLMELDYESLLASMGELEQMIAPFQALLTLIESPEQLNDDDWLEYNSLIEKSFGTPLALAASRKKLYLGEKRLETPPLPEPEALYNPQPEAKEVLASPAKPSTAGDDRNDESGMGLRILLATCLLLILGAVMVYLSQGTFPDGLTLRSQGILIKNINQPLENQDTYLTRAVKEKNLSLISLLIKHGANINAQDADLNTPLHLAVLGAYFEGAELLVQNGADPGIKNSQGKTPGELALMMGNPDIASQLPEGALRTSRDMASARNPFATKE
ncbi:MAG: ankyrin repeat domain-containing protein [Syntrophomonadaceae bacterium]